jgi:hypothetical protein
MKKVARILGLACMVGMIAFTSCSKNEQNAMTISVSTPELTVDEEDRAYIKPNYTFMWEQDDVIKVYNLDATPANSLSRIFHNVSGAGPRANFQGPNVGTARSEGYRFFYPEVMAVGDDDLLKTNNHEHFVVSNTQQYGIYETPGPNGHKKMVVDPDCMPMAVKPLKLTSSTNMKHMFGVARLGFTVDENVEKTVCKVEIFDNIFDLNGDVELCLPAVNTTTLQTLLDYYKAGNEEEFNALYSSYVMDAMEWSPYNNGDNSMTLLCDYPGAEGVTLNDSNAEWFHFMLRPLALSHGFTAKVYFTDHTMLNINQYWNHEMLHKAMEPGIIKTFTYNWPINEADWDAQEKGAAWETWE